MFTFCKPVSSKKRFLPYRAINDDFTFSLFENANSVIREDWTSVTKNNTVFLEIDYLQLIESAGFAKLMPRYVIIYNRNKQPCGIIYFQIVDFKAEVFEDILNQDAKTTKSKRLHLFEKYADSKKENTLLRLFTCGNNLVSGEYGFLFNDAIDNVLQHNLLLNITEIVAKEEKLARTISAILLKDFYTSLEPKELFKDENYTEFFVEPNLVIDIPEGVASLENYVALFSKKYRNRAKSIFKSGEELVIKYLDQKEIILHEQVLYKLYETIFDRAKFKLIKLPNNYFSRVKMLYQKEFVVKAFFYDNKIIAFATSFLMPDKSIEAHYIGFDYELNHQFNLYQNILYGMVSEAINNNFKKVNLGRTAAEIKTTVGAKPQNLVCYIKPQNAVSKFIQKPFISLLQPAQWIPRNPFKEE